MPKVTCLHCSKEFMWHPSQKSGKYCSRDCKVGASILENINSGKASKRSAVTYMKKFVKYQCSCCGIDSWNNKPLTLQIDHIDGNNKNNVPTNLRYLCANCHTQTDTWGHKNVSEAGKQRIQQALNGNKRSVRSVG